MFETSLYGGLMGFQRFAEFGGVGAFGRWGLGVCTYGFGRDPVGRGSVDTKATFTACTPHAVHNDIHDDKHSKLS